MPHARRYTTDWSIVRVAGADAAAFLHNLSTNDVTRLSPGAACETLFTNVKAKVLAHAVLCRHAESDAFDVVVTSSAAASLGEHLDRYHIREDLTLTVVDEPSVAVAFDAGDGGFALPSLGDGARLWIGAAPAEADPLSDSEFDALRIERRFPLDRVDVDERNLPQELGRDAELISFTKGCYLGQETVARIDALGHVNWLLTRLRSTGASPPQSGDELSLDGKAVGRFTGSHAAARGGSLALAYLRREHAEAGATLTAAGGEWTVG